MPMRVLTPVLLPVTMHTFPDMSGIISRSKCFFITILVAFFLLPFVVFKCVYAGCVVKKEKNKQNMSTYKTFYFKSPQEPRNPLWARGWANVRAGLWYHGTRALMFWMTKTG
jgi:hypothetical protein